MNTAQSLLADTRGRTFHTVLADPPWRFENRTGKVAPEHQRLRRYETLPLAEIMALPVAEIVEEPAHCYIWVPNAMLPMGCRCSPPGIRVQGEPHLAQGAHGRGL